MIKISIDLGASNNPYKSNTGHPYALQQGLVEQAIIESTRVWDEDPRDQPIFHRWLRPAPSPRGAMEWSGNIRIDPGGYSPLSGPQADPTMVADYYSKTMWNAYTVKKGMTYDSMDRVHGHPELVNNRSREMIRYNKRAIDVWTARFILGDPVARNMFNPSGEFGNLVINFDVTYGGTKGQFDDSSSDPISVIDDAIDEARYQGSPEMEDPTFLCGPKLEKALKNHPVLRDLWKYSDKSFIMNPEGTYRGGFHGVLVEKMLGSYKTGAPGQGNLERASGGFTKVTVANRRRKFLMDDPLNPLKECGILIWGDIGNMRYAQTDDRQGDYGSGSGYIRGPVEDVIHGVWVASVEHTFCPAVENPFGMVILRNAADSWQKTGT